LFYLIAPPERSGWHLKRSAFARAIEAELPQARFSRPDPLSSTRSIVWDIPDPQGGSRWLEGSLDQAGEAVYLRGDAGLAAAFATWLRKIVDSSQPLTFCDEALTALVELRPDTSVDDIVQAFSANQ